MVVRITPRPHTKAVAIWNWLLFQDIGFKCVGIEAIEADVPDRLMAALREIAVVEAKT